MMPSRISACAVLLGLFLATGCGDPNAQWIAQLQSSDVAVRRNAVRALSLNDHAEQPVIITVTLLTTDSDVEVKSLAIHALGHFGKSAASSLPPLIVALRDSDPHVRLLAALAIQEIDPKNPAFVPVLIAAMRAGDGRVLLDVAAMGAAGAWAVPTLIELLAHPLPQVRALAAQTLGRIGPPAAAAKTALDVATHDSNPAVQQAAHTALDRIHSESATATK
jgi:HEAT repeat protein